MSKKFTVRVELHNADEDGNDYDRLHDDMEEAGFQRCLIYSNPTKKFALPTAEYRYFSETETNQQVADKAYDIANRVKRNPSVISTEGAIAKRGLKEID